jgi:ABC-type bacteriocin/lantibiotic exporter with double-glycine peptidase domain
MVLDKATSTPDALAKQAVITEISQLRRKFSIIIAADQLPRLNSRELICEVREGKAPVATQRIGASVV